MQIQVLPAPTPAFEALVHTHANFCDSTAPAESCHRLPVTALFTPAITVFGAFEGDALLGMGALKTLSKTDGELKSMHTAAEARGKGVAKAILRAIFDMAVRKGIGTLWLETGIHPDFATAHMLYRAHGFTICAPFGDYDLDPHSIFMTKTLEATR